MARKSNKTSHVLNLLTDPKSSESSTEHQNEIPDPAAPMPIEDTASSQSVESSPPMSDAVSETALEPVSEAAPDTAPEVASTKPQQHSSQTPAILAQPSVDISQALEERISKQIHDSLSIQLAEDEAKEAARAEQDRKIAERIAAEMNTEQPTSPFIEQDTTPAKESSPDEQADTPKESTPEYDFELINVMEAILDQFQTEFMEKFGMCTCHRCWLDTRALTLSSLGAKYVVLKRDSVEPMLNFYDHRYRGMIMAQLTQACITVMANPHH